MLEGGFECQLGLEVAFSEARCQGFSLNTLVPSPPSSVNGSAQ